MAWLEKGTVAVLALFGPGNAVGKFGNAGDGVVEEAPLIQAEPDHYSFPNGFFHNSACGNPVTAGILLINSFWNRMRVVVNNQQFSEAGLQERKRKLKLRTHPLNSMRGETDFTLENP